MGERVVELMIDIANDEFLPRLEESVCGRCNLKPVCEHFETSCLPLAILENLFLLGRISFKEATSRPQPPDSGSMTRMRVPEAWIAPQKPDVLGRR